MSIARLAKSFIDYDEQLGRANQSLSEFIKLAWHVVERDTYVHGWHIDAICQHLEAITDGRINRLIINIPPGCMKSLILNVFWPAWEWGAKHLTHHRYVTASHKQDLVIRDNLKLRRLICSQWYQRHYPHVRLKNDQNTKTKFENSLTGFSEVCAVGSLTGTRGHRVKLDDLISVSDANSEAVLNSVMLDFTETIPTRLVNPISSAIVMIMQRVHDLDPTGIAIARNLGYELLILPMEYEVGRMGPTCIGFTDPRTEEGELLFPGRFTREVVERDKLVIGAYGTASQFQQRPTPREGAIIKLAWLTNRYKLQYLPNGRIDRTQFSEIYQSWDTAFKDGEQNDYSVCTTWGMKENGFYLINVWKGKVDFPALEQKFIELSNLYVPNQILIEDKASGQSLAQAAKRRTRLPIKSVIPQGDKIARLHSVTGYFEAMRVFFPENEPWLQDYFNVLTTFPAAAHDDDVDSTTQFFIQIVLRREASMNSQLGSTIGR